MPTERLVEEIQTLIPSGEQELYKQLFPSAEIAVGKLKTPYEKIRQEGITSAQEISKGQVTGDNVSSVLRAWKYTFEKQEDTLPLDAVLA